ncbi:MAG: hypothetical protein HY778_04915 [Betaproteobacteria bacterium]|nr:hypothetical protein [Betaproteobacteria bacterium]
MSPPRTPEIGVGVDYRDPRACLLALSTLPLGNPPAAADRAMELLRGMQNAPPSPAQYLKVLEALRAPLASVLESLAQRYAARPLPPRSSEDEVLRRVTALWHVMARAYAQVARLGALTPDVRERTALLCQRCIHYSGRAMVEYFRARRELPRGMWSEINGYFATAEEFGLGAVPVDEPLQGDAATVTCLSAYAQVLLMDLANPYARSTRELACIERWSMTLAPLIALLPKRAGDGARAYCLDLSADRGAVPLERLTRGPQLRRLDVARLAGAVQHLLARLRSGTSAADLGLGEGCAAADAGRLLLQLYRRWCLSAHARRYPRRRAIGNVELVSGREAIYFHVGGQRFLAPDPSVSLSPALLEQVLTLGEQVAAADCAATPGAVPPGGAPARWDVVDQSPNGFCLRRNESGPRLELGSLVALRPPEGGKFLLARVTWLRYEGTGSLCAGIHVLPGMPDALVVRQAGTASAPARYRPAFMLPAMATLHEPPSLVLPRGWFKPDRVIQSGGERMLSLRLAELLEQGADFDRVSFAPHRAASGRVALESVR